MKTRTHSSMFTNIVMASFVAAVALTMVDFAPNGGSQAVSAPAMSLPTTSAAGSTSVPDASMAFRGVADDSAAPTPTF